MNTENEHVEVEASEVAPTRSLFASQPVFETVQEPTEATETVETAAAVEEPIPSDESAEATTEGTEDASEDVSSPEAPAQEPDEAVSADQPVDDTEETIEEVQEEPVVGDGQSQEAAPKTLKDLQAEREALDKTIKETQDAEQRSVLAQIAAVVKTYNIPIQKIVEVLGGLPNPRKGVAAPILFKDDAGNKWTGRGKTPNWLKGKNIEDYRIK